MLNGLRGLGRLTKLVAQQISSIGAGGLSGVRYLFLIDRSRRRTARWHGATATDQETADVTALDMFVSEVTSDEVAAGFSVREVRHPDRHLPGGRATALSVVHTWGDPSHRLVKMHGRDGRTIFQLQAFGRHRSGVCLLGWFPERYWPADYGPAWVIDRLEEHISRPEYQALIELHVPTGDEDWPTPAGPGRMEAQPAAAGQQGSDGPDDSGSLARGRDFAAAG